MARRYSASATWLGSGVTPALELAICNTSGTAIWDRDSSAGSVIIIGPTGESEGGAEKRSEVVGLVVAMLKAFALSMRKKTSRHHAIRSLGSWVGDWTMFAADESWVRVGNGEVNEGMLLLFKAAGGGG